MDVNGTRFHLLFGQPDWQPLIGEHSNLDWYDAGAAVRLEPLVFRFPTPPGDTLPRPSDRRGAGQDRYGNWYWIGESESEIRYLPLGARRSEHFWSARDWAAACQVEQAGSSGDFRPQPRPLPPADLRFRGLAVTGHHYLVVGVLDPKGLLIFDLHAGGSPIQLLWPAEIEFEPFDFAPSPDDGVWILDRRNLNTWRLDRYFRVVAAHQDEVLLEAPSAGDFHPVGGEPPRWPGRSFPDGISLGLTSSIPGLDPIAIEILPDDSLLILDSDPAVLYRYRYGLQIGPAVDLNSLLAGRLDGPYTLRGHDLAFLPAKAGQPGQVTGMLYLVGSDGNQSFQAWMLADDSRLELEIQSGFFPMRLFAGKALTANFSRQEVYYDMPDRWVPLIEQPRPRFRVDGYLDAGPLDGKEPGCAWHRLFLDGCLPSDCQVKVQSRASDDKSRLASLPWQDEPPLYRRSDGRELPHFLPLPSAAASPGDFGTWELLFQRAQGQFLQLRLSLHGTGRTTPLVQAARVYYPRFSYLKEYLPAVYQADQASASFVERFLANVEGVYTVLEGRIENAHTLIDVHTIPAEYLDWLAAWLGVALEPDWDESRRRLLLKYAMRIFSQRGTLAGLLRSIRLAVDPCPDERLFETDLLSASADPHLGYNAVRIVESYLTRTAPGVVYGDPTDLIGPGLVLEGAPWTPRQGAEPLHQRYRDYLKVSYPDAEGGNIDLLALNAAWGVSYTDASQVRLSPVQPVNPAAAASWRAFLKQGLGFTYAEIYPLEVDPKDERDYQAFLARRYRQVARLNTSYQLTGGARYSSFTDIHLPGEHDFPASGQRLYDWIQFVSLVMPIHRRAHHFTVLVPIRLTSDLTAGQQTVDKVRRVVELEKPAHTSYSIKPYWALFRVGEARLGLDTFLDQGSRFAALILGEGYLAESYLAPQPPWSITDRIVTGRDQPGPTMVL